jgi:hypothetical protein
MSSLIAFSFRDELRGEDDGIPFSQRDLLWSSSVQVRHSSAPLAAGGQDEHLFARQVTHLAQLVKLVGDGH